MKRMILPILVIVCSLLLLSTPALAAGSCGGVETSIIACSEDGGNAIWSILEIAVNVLAGLIGIVAVGGLVYGAVLYSSAGDNASQVTKSKTTITNVVVGLVLFAGMYSFIQFLIPGGVFSRDLNAPVASNTPTERVGGDEVGSGAQNGDGEKGKFLNFKIATFNILGSKHTDEPGGSRTSWPSASVRLPKAMKILEDKKVTVAAIQEVYPDQREMIRKQYSGTWGLAMGDTRGQGRAVIWRKDDWKLIKTEYISVPAAGTKKQVFVLLEQKRSGKKIWFMGIHNVNGTDAATRNKREESLKRERNAINSVKGDGYPIFIAGDFNDGSDGKVSAQCMLTPLMTNIFGNNGSGICGKPRADTNVDHIFYIHASQIGIQDKNIDKSHIANKVSDHPLVTASITAR